MVRNEADILPATLAHIFTQGFDRALVVDNLSTDSTVATVRQLARDFPILLGFDSEPAYYQSVKMTALARWASRHGAGWVVPTDADEFWFAESMRVGDFLRSTHFSVFDAPIHNLFPVSENPNPTGLASGPLRYDHAAYKLPKVALRGSQLLWLGMGNHWGHSPGLTGEGLHVAHLPWRSERQVIRKLRQGAEALAKTSLQQELGGHWREGGARSDEQLHQAWLDLLEGHGEDALGWVPKGPFTVTQASWWGAAWPGDRLKAPSAQ